MNDLEMIKSEVNELIKELSMSLSVQDRKEGWNEAKQKFMLDFYYQLQNELNKKKPYLNKPEYTGIYIRMNYAGISNGKLEDKGTTISHLIREYNNKHKLRNLFLKALRLFSCSKNNKQ